MADTPPSKSNNPMSALVAHLDALEARLKAMDLTPLELLVEKSGGKVKRTYVVLALGGATSCSLYALGGSRLVSHLVGFAAPAYYSFKAIESADTRDDRQWLTYWVVYAFFNLQEVATDFFTGRIQFYHPLKLAFLVWLMHPKTRGATWVYEHVLKPYVLRRMEKPVDRAAANIEGKLNSTVYGVQVSGRRWRGGGGGRGGGAEVRRCGGAVGRWGGGGGGWGGGASRAWDEGAERVGRR